jgi:DNA-binding transcriptional MerR regulator
VAAILRVTKRILWNWERKGILTLIRLLTGQKHYRRRDVEALFR